MIEFVFGAVKRLSLSLTTVTFQDPLHLIKNSGDKEKKGKPLFFTGERRVLEGGHSSRHRQAT